MYSRGEDGTLAGRPAGEERQPADTAEGSGASGVAAVREDEHAILVDNLSKCFQIFDKPQDRLKQSIFHRLNRVAGRPPKRYFHEFWALRDVSFSVRKGETVGIIGRNGSGKSTLLQIICGTLEASGGAVETSGRVAALLELGSGFNPEFTGRENVFMNGAVLGLSNEQIEERFDDIAAFADIGEFVEQPVKTYSSGMMVRLAFAVAINVDPEILIVDEALSVGDELFQRKCFSKIEALKQDGATILFVSHAGPTLVELCDWAILLDHGELLTYGKPKAIVGRYQKLLYAPADKCQQIREEIRMAAASVPDKVAAESTDSDADARVSEQSEAEPEEFYDPNLKPKSTIAYESHGAVIYSPEVLNLAGEPVNCLRQGKIYRYCYMVRFDVHATQVRFGMLIKTMSGMELGGATSAPVVQDALTKVAAGSMVRVEFRFQCSLNPGTYFLNAGVVGIKDSEETYLHRLLDACMFRVMPSTRSLATGIVDFNCAPDITVLREEGPAMGVLAQ